MKRTLSLAALLSAAALHAAPYRFEVSANRQDCRYGCGEDAVFTVKVSDVGTDPTNRLIDVTLDNYGEKVFFSRKVDAAKEPVFTVKGTRTEPGVLRLLVRDPAMKASGYYSIGEGNVCRTVCFEPERIRLEDPPPDDFDAYWDGERKRLAETVPLDPRIEQVHEASTNGFNCWRVSFATFGGLRVNGIVMEPKAPGRYPLHVRVPGAGPDMAIESMPRLEGVCNVIFNVFSHPAPLTCKEAKRIYPGDSYFYAVPKDRDDMRFHDMALGMDRAIDWLARRPNIDSENILYSGGSQGGAYGIMILALNRTITRAYIWISALGDLHGSLHGRRGGPPSMLLNRASPAARPQVEKILRYYEGANFARRIRIPVRMYMGLADTVCPPFSIWAIYNSIASGDKDVRLDETMGHGMSGPARAEFDSWLFRRR